MAKSINIAIIVGNLTRDPELRYTPAGHAVCSFGVATNRVWKTAEGERREDAEFHNVVAWNKLAEICSQYLAKGRKVYIQGRLQTRTWEGQNGVRRSRTEIVADDMVILSPRPGGVAPGTEDYVAPAAPPAPAAVGAGPKPVAKAPTPPEDLKVKVGTEVKAENESKIENKKQGNAKTQKGSKSAKKEDVNPKEMPF